MTISAGLDILSNKENLEGKMAKIGLIVRQGVDEALKLGLSVVNWCNENDHELVVENNTYESLATLGDTFNSNTSKAILADLPHQTDPIISLGGDGTLLGIARFVDTTSPVLIGVNFGNLGFLTEVKPSELFITLEKFFKNEVKLGLRSLISAKIIRKGKEIFNSNAANDIVIQKVLGIP